MFEENEQLYKWATALQQELEDAGFTHWSLWLKYALTRTTASEVFGEVRGALVQLNKTQIPLIISTRKKIKATIEFLNRSLGTRPPESIIDPTLTYYRERWLSDKTVLDAVRGWKFTMGEVSNNVFKASGLGKGGIITSIGVFPDQVLASCIRKAEQWESKNEWQERLRKKIFFWR